MLSGCMQRPEHLPAWRLSALDAVFASGLALRGAEKEERASHYEQHPRPHLVLLNTKGAAVWRDRPSHACTGLSVHVPQSSPNHMLCMLILFLHAQVRRVFSDIYRKNTWGGEGGGSGGGSTMEKTATIRSALPALIAKYNISSILDSPCGG